MKIEATDQSKSKTIWKLYLDKLLLKPETIHILISSLTTLKFTVFRPFILPFIVPFIAPSLKDHYLLWHFKFVQTLLNTFTLKTPQIFLFRLQCFKVYSGKKLSIKEYFKQLISDLLTCNLWYYTCFVIKTEKKLSLSYKGTLLPYIYIFFRHSRLIFSLLLKDT